MTKLGKRLPPLGCLITFDAAFRHGSFTRAADELALSQASVSRQIRLMETNLGFPLFERRRYDVIPTEEGRILAETVTNSLLDIAKTTDKLRARFDKEETLTILADLGLASGLLAPLLGGFQRLFPGTHLSVLATTEPIEQVKEHFDIGLQSGYWAPHTFEIIPIMDDILFPVCSPTFARNLPNNLNAETLVHQPLLHFKQPSRDWPDWKTFLAVFGAKLDSPLQGLEVSSYAVYLDVAENGEGIALGWGRQIMTRLSSGRLIRITEMSMSLPQNISIYLKRHENKHPLTQSFIDYLRENVDGLPA